MSDVLSTCTLPASALFVEANLRSLWEECFRIFDEARNNPSACINVDQLVRVMHKMEHARQVAEGPLLLLKMSLHRAAAPSPLSTLSDMSSRSGSATDFNPMAAVQQQRATVPLPPPQYANPITVEPNPRKVQQRTREAREATTEYDFFINDFDIDVSALDK